jgi:hypothetical protein
LTPDSIVPNLYKPIAWNRYAFNYNNPVNYTDPLGHSPADLLDIFFFVSSLASFGQAPGLGTGFELFLDTVDLLPGVTGLGWGDEFAGTVSKVANDGKPLTRLQALERMDEIRANTGNRLVLFRGTGRSINSPAALRASKFRGDPRTVTQIAYDLRNYDWDEAASVLGSKHARSSFGSPFLSSTPLPRTALMYACKPNIWPTSGYIIAFSVDDALRLPRRNPSPFIVDKIEYLIPVGIIKSDIIEVIPVRKDWTFFDDLTIYDKFK